MRGLLFEPHRPHQQLGPCRPLLLRDHRRMAPRQRPHPTLPAGGEGQDHLGATHRHRQHNEVHPQRRDRRHLPNSGHTAPPPTRPHPKSDGLALTGGGEEGYREAKRVPLHPLPNNAKDHPEIRHREIPGRGAEGIPEEIRKESVSTDVRLVNLGHL